MVFSESEYEIRRAALEECYRLWSENQRSNTLTANERRDAALKKNECRTAFHASFGWHEIDDPDGSVVFSLSDRLDELYHDDVEFKPSPSAVWDISDFASYAIQSPSQIALADDLRGKCLRALKRCAVDHEPWYAFENINHPSYLLRFEDMPDHIADWPIDLIPGWDPCFIVAPDFSCGIIATLRDSIRVFGVDLLEAINSDLPDLFSRNPSAGQNETDCP